MAFPSSSVTPPTLSAWQLSYLGLTIGPSTPYGITEIDGLDLDKWRSGDAGRPRDHGEFIGLDLLPGREIVVTLDVQSTPTTTFATALSNLANALVPQGVTEQPLFFQDPTYGRLVTMARPRRKHMPRNITYALGQLAKGSIIEFHSTDPRFYSTPTLSSTISLPAPSGGFSFPFTFPLPFGGSSSPNAVTLDNLGNIDCKPIFTINGPCKSPSITNASISGNPELTFGLSLNAGDKLVIDTDLHSATYYASGSTQGSSRLNTITAGSQWFSLAPGNNTIQFNSADITTVAATLVIQSASAYVI